MRAAKTIAPSAAASRRRRLALAARPGTRIFFLVRQMSRCAACPAPRRKKRSEQTIYDAATREVLQIEFPSRRNRSFWKLGAVTREIHTGCKIKAGRKARECMAIISCGTGSKSPPRLKGILVLRVRPSCRKRSSSSPAAPNFNTQYACRMPVVHTGYL